MATEGTRTLLYVEDVAVLRRVITIVLEGAGYNVLVAGDATEARQVASSAAKIDALVTDVLLPDMNGYVLAQSLRAAQPDLRVIYVSGHEHPVGLEEALAVPRTTFLQKPFTPDTLLGALERTLAG